MWLLFVYATALATTLSFPAPKIDQDLKQNEYDFLKDFHLLGNETANESWKDILSPPNLTLGDFGWETDRSYFIRLLETLEWKLGVTNKGTEDRLKTGWINQKATEDISPQQAMQYLVRDAVNHEMEHVKEFYYGYTSDLLERELNPRAMGLVDKGLNFISGFIETITGEKAAPKQEEEEASLLNEVKRYLEDLLQNNNVTYNRFLDYVVNYVQENTFFWHFTRDRTGFEELTVGKPAVAKAAAGKAAVGSTGGTSFDKDKKTAIILHGWINGGNNFYSNSMIQAFKDYTKDYNIISVDWSKLSYTFYTLSRLSVNFVGPYVARLVDHLVTEEGANLDDIHILGHSLGAHVAGIAGMFVRTGKVGRITGFDPASPLFGDDDRYRLDSSDAKFVDIIHSSLLGVSDAVGHADFYPNGGGPNQPGCGINIAVCPHRRGYNFFVESMDPKKKDDFLAYPCDSWVAFQDGNCTTNPQVMGIDASSETRGKFYLRTGEESPFALGVRTLEPLGLLKPKMKTRSTTPATSKLY